MAPFPRPLPDIPGVYFGRIQGTCEGRPTGNIFTFQTSAPPSPGAADEGVAAAVASALDISWTAFTPTWYPSAYAATEIQVYPLHTPLSPPAIATSGAVGGVSGDLAPFSTAALVRHTVLRRGRGSQSRTSLSPITANHVTPDGISLVSGFLAILTANFGTFMASILSSLDAGGPGTFSYVQLARGTTLHPTPGTFPITGSVGEPLLSTQRRRVRRNG